MAREELLQAWENRRLVGGVLKCANVRRDYSNYEDLFMDGILIYADEIVKWQEQGKTRAETDQLAFRKILWRITDSLRRSKLQEEVVTPLTSITDLPIANWDELDQALDLQGALTALTTAERELLLAHFVKQRTLAAIADEEGVCLQTISRRKQRILQKLRGFLTAR